MTGSIFATEPSTDLENHLKAGADKINNEEKLFDENVYPGTFDVSYVGIDETTNGPVFHIQFVSHTFYSSGRDYSSRVDVTGYMDGKQTLYDIKEHKEKIISEKTDDSNNKWQTVSSDYYAVFYNQENLPLDQTYSFALTRESQHGHVMFAINAIDFDIVYDPEYVESDADEGASFTEIDENSDDTKKQNAKNRNIYGLVTTLFVATGGLILLRRRKKIKLKRRNPIKKIIEPKIVEPPVKKPNLINKIGTAFRKTSEFAMRGLKKVSTTLSDGFTKLKSIGINTRLGRIEIGDLLGLAGADKVANVVNTISDLCDLLNKNKDLNKVWSNFVDRTVNSKMGQLKRWFGRGLKVDPKMLRKLININKELKTIAGLMKDGISADELLNINRKLASYKQGVTPAEKFKTHLQNCHNKAEKGMKIEGENFKTALKWRN